MPVILLQIKPLLIHKAVGIVLGRRNLSQLGQANGSYVAYNTETTAKPIQPVTTDKVLSADTVR